MEMKNMRLWKCVALLACMIACVLMFASCSGGGAGSHGAGSESGGSGVSSGEAADPEGDPVLKDCPVEHEEEFGGVYIKNTIDEFNAYGFDYGDSVSISFTNGYKLEDIPYYNGYYTRTGETLLVAYPG